MSRVRSNDDNKRASIVSEDDFEGGTKISFLRRLSKSDRDSDGRLSRHGSTSSMNLAGIPGSLKQSMLNLCHSIHSKITDKEHKSSITSIDASQLPPKASRKLSNKDKDKDKDNYDTVSLSGTRNSFTNSFRKSFMNKIGISTKTKKRNNSKGESNSMISELALSTSRLSVSDLDIRDEKHPKLQASPSIQVSPKSPINATPILSPTSLREISYPRAVDNEKMQEFTSSKQSTIQKMLEQAMQRYQNLKEEHDRNPSELNQTNVENQEKVIKRLKSQLSQTPTTPSATEASLPLSSSGASMKESATDRRSSCMENSASSLDDKEDSSSSSCGLPLHAYHQQRNGSKLCSKLKSRNAYLNNSSLSRSHSDSYKQRQEYLDSLKPSVSSDDFSSLAENSSIGKRRQILSRSHSKSQGGTSDGNSDADQLHPLAEEHSASSLDVSNSTNSISGRRNSQQSIAIMAFDEEDMPEELEKKQWRENQFSKFEEIRNKPAHLAVFLLYLISNSDPAPLLFHLVTEGFGLGKDSAKDIRRWAYELYTTFLHEKAPLKFDINTATQEAIHEILSSSKTEKEDKLVHLFDQVRTAALGQVKDLFADFGNKLSLGLGGFYGENELKDVNSTSSEFKFIENNLWRQFNTLALEDNDRSSATCSALLTYFLSINFPLPGGGSAEKFTPFMHKEKTKFSVFSKSSKKTVQSADHHLHPHQYFTMTYCNACAGLIGGLGFQGFVCQKCEYHFHKGCVGKIKEKCKRVDRSKTTPNIIRKKISMKGPLALAKQMEENETDAPHLPRAVSLMSLKETDSSHKRSSRFFHDKIRDSSKDSSISSSSKLSRDDSLKSSLEQTSLLVGITTGTKFQVPQEPFRSGSPEPDDESREFFDPVNKLFPNQHIPALSNNSQVEINADSDFEVETDVPSLESYIPKDCFKKMKPKEKKRQNIINELFHTERNHVRNMKAMHHVIYLRMNNEFSKDFVNLLFPNLDDLIKVHDALNKEFKKKKNESENFVVENFADILVNHFTGDTSDKFKNVCALFCEKQSQALEKLKVRQKKDQKLAAFLQEAANNPLCRRFELKDLLPTAMQRLTKYPLFISGLLKYTSDAEECKRLEVALTGSKSILEHVDKAVQRYENHLKLVEMQKRLDKKAIENAVAAPLAEYRQLDLTRHSLVFEGALTWRIRDRLIPLQVVLLDDILLLLQKQDDKLVLKCQSMYIAAGKVDTRMTHSPIIKLVNLLIKNVATDPQAFFIVSQFTSFPQIYDLIAPSKEEKDKWCKRITEASDAYKAKHPEENCPEPQKRSRAHQPQRTLVQNSAAMAEPLAPSSSSAAVIPPPLPPLVSDASTTIPESEEDSIKSEQPRSSASHRGPDVPQFSFESQVSVEPSMVADLRAVEVDYYDDDKDVWDCGNEGDAGPSVIVVKLRNVDKRIDRLMREKRRLVDSLGHSGKKGEQEQEALEVQRRVSPSECIQSLLMELDSLLKMCNDLESSADIDPQLCTSEAQEPKDVGSIPDDANSSQSFSSLPQGLTEVQQDEGKIVTSHSDSQLSSTARPERRGDGNSALDSRGQRTDESDVALLEAQKFADACRMIQSELLDLLEFTFADVGQEAKSEEPHVVLGGEEIPDPSHTEADHEEPDREPEPGGEPESERGHHDHKEEEEGEATFEAEKPNVLDPEHLAPPEASETTVDPTVSSCGDGGADDDDGGNCEESTEE